MSVYYGCAHLSCTYSSSIRYIADFLSRLDHGELACQFHLFRSYVIIYADLNDHMHVPTTAVSRCCFQKISSQILVYAVSLKASRPATRPYTPALGIDEAFPLDNLDINPTCSVLD
jgi:hypothetical protein